MFSPHTVNMIELLVIKKWQPLHFLFLGLSPLSSKKFCTPQVTQFLEGPTPAPFIRWGKGVQLCLCIHCILLSKQKLPIPKFTWKNAKNALQFFKNIFVCGGQKACLHSAYLFCSEFQRIIQTMSNIKKTWKGRKSTIPQMPKNLNLWKQFLTIRVNSSLTQKTFLAVLIVFLFCCTYHRVFQIVLKGGRIPHRWGGMGNFARGILLGGGNLRKNNFDPLNLFLKTMFFKYWT